jgi:hypothetical protein
MVKRMDPPDHEVHACRKRACAIQKCLASSGYDMKACAFEIEALRQCCEKAYAVNSLHCAAFFDSKVER